MEKLNNKNINKLTLEKINKIIDSLDNESLKKLKKDLIELKNNINNEDLKKIIDEIIKKIDDKFQNNEIYLV